MGESGRSFSKSTQSNEDWGQVCSGKLSCWPLSSDSIDSCRITGVHIFWLFLPASWTSHKDVLDLQKMQAWTGKSPGLSPVYIAIVLALCLREVWLSKGCAVQGRNPSGRKASIAAWVRKTSINTIAQHALGILHVILDSKYLFQGLLPHQEPQETAGRSTKSAVHRLLLSSGCRLAVHADVSFFGGLLLLIYLYYWKLFSPASMISWPDVLAKF